MCAAEVRSVSPCRRAARTKCGACYLRSVHPFTPTLTAEGVRFPIHVQPRSRRPGVDGVHGSALRVRVAAAPVDGAANEAIVELLAAALGVPRRAVSIVSGFSSRAKTVEVHGVGIEQVIALVASGP